MSSRLRQMTVYECSAVQRGGQWRDGGLVNKGAPLSQHLAACWAGRSHGYCAILVGSDEIKLLPDPPWRRRRKTNPAHPAPLSRSHCRRGGVHAMQNSRSSSH